MSDQSPERDLEGEECNRYSGRVSARRILAAIDKVARIEDRENLFSRTVEFCHLDLGFDRASVWLPGAESNTIRGTHGVDEKGHIRDERHILLRLSEETPMRLVLEKYQHGKRFPDCILCDDRMNPVGRGTHVILPLRDQRRVVGLLCLDNLLSGHEIDEEDVEFMSFFADAVGRRYQELLWKDEISIMTTAITQASEGIAVADQDGTILFCNAAFSGLHGYRPEEVTGKHLRIFHSPEQIPEVQAAIQTLHEIGEYTLDVWHTHRNGALFLGRMNGALVRDSRGNPIAMVATLHDVTREKEKEERLLLLSSAIGQAMDGIAFRDMEGNLLYVNESMAAMHGLSIGEMIGRNVRDFCENETGDGPCEACHLLLESGNLAKQTWHRRADGTRIRVMCRSSLVRNPTGNPLGVVNALHDVSEAHALEQSRMERLRRLEVLAEISPKFLSQENLSGLLRLSVETGLRLLQGRVGLAIFEDPIDRKTEGVILRPGEDGTNEPQEITRLNLQASVLPSRLFYTNQFRPGDLEGALDELGIQKVLAAPLPRDSGKASGFLLVADPTTKQDWSIEDQLSMDNWSRIVSLALERFIMEKQLVQRSRELARAVQTRDQLVVMARHDLRYPLQSMLSLLTLMKNGWMEMEAGSLKMEESIHRLAAMMTDLLGPIPLTGGGIPLQPREEDLGLVIGCVMESMKWNAIVKNIQIRREGNEIRRFPFDPNRIEELLVNLVSNGIKYTHPGGEVVLSTSQTQDHAVIQVKDTGQGIPREELARVFDPGARLSPKPTGGEMSHGVGLSVAYAIAEAHGGHIQVESELGRGTTFRLHLPLEIPEKAAPSK